MAHTSDVRVHGPALAERFAQFRNALVQRFNERRIYRQTLVELSQLSDRELNDLGLSRSMIRSVAKQASKGA